MPFRAYEHKNFQPATLKTIRQVQKIIGDYQQQGYTLTLRQLYYQLVSRGLVPNEQSAYNRLGRIVSDARMAGLVDWSVIEDRTRSLKGNSHWSDPSSMVSAAARSYRIDCWKDQPCRVEVWVEKDALLGVVERSCSALDVDFFSCRGYTSQSEMWRASQRVLGYVQEGQAVTVLHLGDHDPSGIDMTRDIRDRLSDFVAEDYMRAENRQRITYAEIHGLVSVKRIALNRDQIERYDPPPNPAKTSDSRFEEYLAQHGDTSWELDALEPNVLGALIEREVAALRSEALWEARLRRQRAEKALLRRLSDNIEEVQAFLERAS